MRTAIFNHKGGVGKTVLAYHLAWKLTQKGKRVLLVDGDSQVNLTALSMGTEAFENHYVTDETRSRNIRDGVADAFEGRSSNLEGFDCPNALGNDKLFILPGHPELSTLEGQLSLAQETYGSLSVLRSLPGALSALIGRIERRHRIDITLVDLNPGLGAINQNLFSSCKSFIVPTNPDPFSLMAVDTLRDVVIRWNNWKENNLDKYLGADFLLPKGTIRFIGNVNARFNKHASKAGAKFDERMRMIDSEIYSRFAPALDSAGMLYSREKYERAFEIGKEELSPDSKALYALARIPDFQSLIQYSYKYTKPVFCLTDSNLRAERLGGNSLRDAKSNIAEFEFIFNCIANKFLLISQDDDSED
ncbi:ParA family protein [Jannaschia sp. W003]|uniref:ParA family protein n=1 Tax=Jannaschia sp. W003 TaxID=2867012 RepID=UPI0021A2AFD2|nr:ParA family protein [Jannaschia sp. W003]UWQ21285.1 ParA family protein [Jannaschia sp. W003]